MKFKTCTLCETSKQENRFVTITYRNPDIKFPPKKANVCLDCQEQKLTKIMYQIVGEDKNES